MWFISTLHSVNIHAFNIHASKDLQDYNGFLNVENEIYNTVSLWHEHLQ